jgi:HD-GYP domain-containing protein (c-di-GMP phosphodiesterase class II)
LGLLINSYCHADAAEQATWFADDIGFKAEGVETLGMNTAQVIALFVRRIASHGNAAQRAKRLVRFPLTGQQLVLGFVTTHAALGARFAERIGFDPPVCAAIGQAYEQWDGKGAPSRLRGDQIGLPARLVQLAGPVEVFGRRHGVQSARAMARRQSGSQFDPALVEVFCDHAAELLDGLDEAADWDAVLGAEPQPSRRVSGADLDGVLEAMADLADLKSPNLAGHSRGVANLAHEAARAAGLSTEEALTVRRAGLIHDLGRPPVARRGSCRPAGRYGG